MRLNECAVLIVGGGPVGLSLGLLLGRFGIPAILLERHATTTDHPKARGCTARTMELFRIWGIEEPIRRGGLPSGADHWSVGLTLASLYRTRSERDTGQAAAWKSIVSQDIVEQELLRAVRARPSTEYKNGSECTGFTQDASGVTAYVNDVNNGEKSEIRCQYLVACDGAGSRMRTAAGIKMTGIPSLGFMSNNFIDLDLGDFELARNSGGILMGPREPTDGWLTLLNSNGRNRWLATSVIGAASDERKHVPAETELVADLKRRIGLDRNIRIISQSSWRAAREVAETYRNQRIFLAGDAAHRFLPTGGQGMNTGIADAHNLAWKLAFSIKGEMRPEVLDSYDAERRPIGNETADFQLRTGNRMQGLRDGINFADVDNVEFWIDELSKHMRNVGLSLGLSYSQGLIIEDGTTAPALDPERYVAVDRPGHRFPHLWVERDQSESSIDWFDAAFVLVTGPDALEWRAAAETVSREIAAPLKVKTLHAPNRELGIMMMKQGATLVRPDGYVAWRCPSRSVSAAEELREVMRTLLVAFKR